MCEKNDKAFVLTLPERCKTCYTCVRECPAKAIRIMEGQAQIIASRCIACGNCVRVCSQDAKQIRNTLDRTVALLDGDVPVAAIVAPSFPAAFPDIDFRVFVGMVRAAGFAYVHEVAFGADLVARKYRELLASNNDNQRYIATACPAVVGFVERYQPSLVSALAPIVSPMVAMARVVRIIYGDRVKIVFLGPCIAKKAEVEDTDIPDELDGANTFVGLQELFDTRHVTPDNVQPSDFDPPHADLGALFPITRGMLQAADMDEDLIAGDIVSASGREGFVESLREFASGALDAQLLDVLACNGCIMGPGMPDSEAPLFRRRSQMSRYVRERIKERHAKQWAAQMHRFRDLDLSRVFTAHDERIPSPPENEVGRILAEMGKLRPEDELNCGACGYDTCREHAVAILKGLAENKMCLPYTIEQLNRTIGELGVSNDQLAKTQEALLQSEKLASMGQLAAGIAHELNNPLGVVLMYAHLLLEGAELDDSLAGDLNMIAGQADRCKKIVSGLLHFARQNKTLLEPTDVRKLVDKSIRSIVIPANVTVACRHLMEDPTVDIDPDQMLQVLTNLLSNACSAMPEGGTLTVRTEDCGAGRFAIRISDTGTGIEKANIKKIFEPFFTTKPMGEGTGLGLAVAYGIIKMHCGDLSVESNADATEGPTGSTFSVTLPKHGEIPQTADILEKEAVA